MSYRIARVSHVIRDVVSDAIANRIWDPRVNHFTSVTRVEVSPDLRLATIFVSVMGTDTEARTTLQGLQSARGMIQTRLARRLNTRHCPIIRFHLDEALKAGIEAARRIEEVRAEAEQRRPEPEVDTSPSSTGPGNNPIPPTSNSRVIQ